MERIIITQHGNIALVVPEKQDLDIMLKGINNLEVSKFISIGNPLGIMPREAESLWLEKELSKSGHFACIYLLAEKQVVGGVDIHAFSEYNRNGELGICIYDHSKLSQWIGTQATRLILRYAFEMQWLHKMTLGVRGDNIRGIKCYEKCWFREAARYREHIWTGDKYEDNVGMEILRKDYETLKTEWFS